MLISRKKQQKTSTTQLYQDKRAKTIPPTHTHMQNKTKKTLKVKKNKAVPAGWFKNET